MKARVALLGWVLTALFPSLLAAHVDGMTLAVSVGTGPDEVRLDWSGGQPTFQIYRSTSPMAVISPVNLIGESDVRTWVDVPGPGDVFFYEIASPCQYNPPEICDGLDNNCDGVVDEPGSEISCNLPNAVPQCAGGACVIGACVAGFGDCDGQVTDGCEAPTDAIPNCGACGQTCDDGNGCTVESCVASACRNIDQRSCWAAPTSGEGGVNCATSPMAAGCWGTDCTEEVVPPPPGCSQPDTDGDGLPDKWEIDHAVDGNCDGDLTDTGPGGLDVNLPDDPDWDEVTQKNAYVAYDWMEKDPSNPGEAQHEPMDDFIGKDFDGTTDAPVKGTITRVVEAFARQGIRLKISKNTNPSMISPTNPTGITSPLPHMDVVTFANPPGECALNSGANTAVSFYALKGQDFNPRFKFMTRYAVFAHNVQCRGNCSSTACVSESSALGLCGPVGENTTGLAELPGEDIIISLGGQGLDDGSAVPEPQRTALRDNLIKYQAGTFMHELGHTYGLDHGGANSTGTCDPGGDNAINRKPNYPSTMQYSLQFTGIRTAATNCSTTPLLPVPSYAQFDPGAWRVDYSSSQMTALNESSLTESGGISTCVCGMTNGLRDISLAYGNCTGLPMRIPGCGPVDWNRNAMIDPISVAVDVNQDSLDVPVPCPRLGLLAGFDDWTYVKAHLAFQCGVNFIDGPVSHQFPGTKELDEQLLIDMGR